MSPAPAADGLAAARVAFQRTFGYADFYPHQAAVLPRVLAGETLLVVWPTGGGKSLLYQLPALVEPGPTLVVSPLIALMQDQWRALQERGIAADALHSHLPTGGLERVLQRLRYGETRLLYLAPERLRDPRLLHALLAAPRPVARIAVDEAHCITEWGHDFREDYMGIPRARAALGSPPMLLLTATATPTVQRDIRACMDVAGCPVVVGPLDRPNLWLGQRIARSQHEKLAALEDLVPRLAGRNGAVAPGGTSETAHPERGVGLVYCATRAQTETVVRHLGQRGFDAEAYHAGLRPGERAAIQDAFLADELDCVVATNAFGMGIDKPDVRWVIHYAHPGSLEAYYQEIGRVGRDGAPAECVLLFGPGDAQVHRVFIREACPPVDAVVGTFAWVRSRGHAGEVALHRPDAERLKHHLYLLESVGAVEPVLRRGRRASVHLRVQAADVVGEAPTGRAREVWTVLEELFDVATHGGVGPVDVVGRTARELGWSAAEVEQALYDLEAAGLIAYRPADGDVLYRVPEARLRDEQVYALGEELALRRRLRTARLEAMQGYAHSTGCLREALLGHFGVATPEACGHCSGCGTRS